MTFIDPRLAEIGLASQLSDQTIAGLLNSLPTLVWVANSDGETIYLNQALRNHVGITSHENISKQISEAIHSDDREQVLAQWSRANRDGAEAAIEYRLRRGIDGLYRWMSSRYIPIRWQNTQVQAWLATSVDIHEQKVSALRMDRLRRLTEKLGAAISIREVAEISLNEVVDIIGAHSGTAIHFSNDGEASEVIGILNVSSQRIGIGTKIPVTEYRPAMKSVRDARPVYLENPAEIRSQLPDFAPILESDGIVSGALVPMGVESRVIGAIGFGFREQRRFTAEEQSFLETIAATCAQALNRTSRVETARERAEAEHRRWFELFERMPANIAIVRGPEHRYVFANETYRRNNPHDTIVLGKTLSESHPGLGGGHALEITDHVFRTGEAFLYKEYEVPIMHPDGVLRSHFYTGTMMPWVTEGQIEGVINMHFDVTEHITARKAAEKNEARLNEALEAGGLGIWEWDASTNRTWRGGWHDRIFGANVSDDAWTVEKFVEHFHPEDRERASHIVQDVVMKGGEFSFETRIIRGDGTIRWIFDAGKVTLNEERKAINASGIVFDITRLKETEAELKEAKDRAEAADRAKTEFVGSMSHEFRTPLTAILGYAELLDQPLLKNEIRSSYVDGILRNGQMLVKLLEDILDLSKVEAGRLDIEPQTFAVRELVREVAHLFSDRAEKSKLRLRMRFSKRLPNFIVSDPSRLKQILTNVIGNAMKFTESGSVTIEVTLHRGMIEFRVIDTGIGIGPEDARKVFKPFVQVESRKYGGTGLGLSISWRLAQALGGDLVLKTSEEGVGSRFDILIPYHPAEDNIVESPVANQKPIDLSGFHLLLVEDTDDVRVLLKQQLEARGAKVDVAIDGKEGFERAQNGSFDLVLMDVRMPVMDGLESTSRLRAAGFRTPIVAVSAFAQADDRIRALDAGCDAYLTKPVRFHELASMIRRLALKTKR